MIASGGNFETLIDKIGLHARKTPDLPAFEFLIDGEDQEVLMTYEDLNRQAKKIAAYLQQLNAGGERILLLFPPGLEYIAGFIGSMYAGSIAVPAYPPDVSRLERSLPRLIGIAKNAQAGYVLTTSMILNLAAWLMDQFPELNTVKWIAIDHILQAVDEEDWRHPEIKPDTLAFLQYTSGSTAEPKGVMISHKNLLSNMRMINKAFELDISRDRGMFWLPTYHDMGLIGGILTTLNEGGTTTLMSPLDFLQRPARWLQAVSRKRATISGGPNFAYDLCVRKVTSEQKKSLNLSSWDLAVNGAEPIRADTIERFVQAFSSCGFRKEAFFACYGLAEATLIVSGIKRFEVPGTLSIRKAALGRKLIELVPPADPDSMIAVSCGFPSLDEKLQIVDPETLIPYLPDPDGLTRVGEIWVSGDNVAQGYWNRPEESENVFQAHVPGSGETNYLRTGDLGFIRHGELFVTGRIKDLIIIDGLNHYPQDIEITVENSHPALRPGCCAAFGIVKNDEEQLVVVVEVAKPAYLSTLKENLIADIRQSQIERAVRDAVAREHNLALFDIVLLKPGTIPKTSSGKIQRHACKAGFLAENLEIWQD